MQNIFVFPVFMFSWNNNSSCLLSVYAPDTWYIWRRMNMRMLVCSDVLLCTSIFFPPKKPENQKDFKDQICWVLLSLSLPSSWDLDYEILWKSQTPHHSLDL